jgi:hypothetical protein
LASKIVSYLQQVYENSLNQPLQEETVAEDLEFKDAVLAMEEIQSAFKEEKTE